MRIAFVHNLFVDHLGFYTLSSLARRDGHDVRVFLTDRHLERDLRAYAPDVVAFTAVTGNHLWAAQTAAELRVLLPRTFFVMGGPHPTYYPEIVMHDGLDAICRGEGETVWPTLLRRIEARQSLADLAGLWVKEEGRLHRNPLAPSVEDLDALPFPDRSLYDRFGFMRRNAYPLMITSRGCPFRCTFCYSPTLMEMTKGQGKFVRFRSVGNVIAEAQEILAKRPVAAIEFVDDIFGMHRPWLREFAARWPHEVGVPFNASIRADLILPEVAALLADAGCQTLAIGLESGNDRVRNEILQKEISREQVVAAAAQVKRHRMKFITYNIVGSPGESFDDAMDTVRLNREIEPAYAQCSIMQPYPKTGIFDIAVRQGMIRDAASVDEIGVSFMDRAIIQTPDRRRMANLQKLFYLCVRFPRLEPLIRLLTRLPENRLFYAAFLAVHATYWVRVKRVRARFLISLILNMKEMYRRHRAGLYRQTFPKQFDDTAAPTVLAAVPVTAPVAEKAAA